MQAVLLFVNGLAILNNERFLEPCKSCHDLEMSPLQSMMQSCTFCGLRMRLKLALEIRRRLGLQQHDGRRAQSRFRKAWCPEAADHWVATCNSLLER